MNKLEQGYDPRRGWRWYAITSGKIRVVWGHTKALAIVAGKRVAVDHGEDFVKVEPAPKDFRNKSRGGVLTQKLTFLISKEDWDLLHDAFPATGTFAVSVRNTLMDAVRKLLAEHQPEQSAETD